ncbi:hypothetical protein R5R35_003157 [Gryllus longicercus]|uniref:Calpain catalytic domain-containing protein n=1 Tax=Gryllus longicercus TaxID=2509291 RepID=A0AAN9VQU8_9ORTH
MPLKEKEKSLMQKLVSDQKYVDEDFPLPEDNWLRPHEIVPKPKMFVDGPSHMDIIQENLGDCWFLAAATVVAQHPNLIHQVIPVDQPLYGKDYQGILVFRFWYLGKWTPVYIDDRLAVSKNKHLVYGKCTKKNEFWLPLLEKAFAKFHGGYEKIHGGLCGEAFLCLTGYICHRFFLEPAINEVELFDMFTREIQHNALIAVGAPVGDRKQGIPGRHAYSVTGVYTVRAGDNIVRLVRVRNPWGARANTVEWKGAFSDNDPKWTGVDEETKKKLEYVKEEDGQFFMRISNFVTHFPMIWFASPFPDFGDNYETTSLQTYLIWNSWDAEITMEGDTPREVFLKSPQYSLTVGESNQPEKNSEDESDIAPTYDVIIEVVQEQNRKEFEEELYPIGIAVFKMGGKFPRKFTADTMEDFQLCDGSEEAMPTSSVIAKLQLDPGKYLVIPCAMATMKSRQFLMRIFSRKPIKVAEIERD